MSECSFFVPWWLPFAGIAMLSFVLGWLTDKPGLGPADQMASGVGSVIASAIIVILIMMVWGWVTLLFGYQGCIQ